MTEQAPRPPGLDQLDDESFQRLYGRWEGMTPAEVAALLDGAPFRWWVAGGWAAEAAGGTGRRHEDTDVKARQQRPKDEADFAAAVPRLSAADREWLAGALEQAHPHHTWHDELL